MPEEWVTMKTMAIPFKQSGPGQRLNPRCKSLLQSCEDFYLFICRKGKEDTKDNGDSTKN